MTITLTPDLEQKLARKAQELGTTPENFVLSKIQQEFTETAPKRQPPFEPQDEWERRLLGIGIDCGVSLSNEAVSSEGLYE